MIVDRTWNKKDQKLTISYIDKLGNRQFYSKYLHHIKTYEYDVDGDLDTWNNKKCKRVFKDTTQYTPNEFDILEFLYELPKDINDILHAQNFPKIYTFDIETEISDEFPFKQALKDPEKWEGFKQIMKDFDIPEENLEWYTNLRRFGGCKHAGVGVGFERLVMYLTGISNIRDVIPYPRTTGSADF